MERPPDLVVELPVEFEVPATGVVPVFTLWLKLPIRDEKFIEAMEIKARIVLTAYGHYDNSAANRFNS